MKTERDLIMDACKARAKQGLKDTDAIDAVMVMMVAVQSNPETSLHRNAEAILTIAGMKIAQSGDIKAVEKWIDDFA